MAESKVIATRRDARIHEKEDIWKLTADSYAGGEQYRKGNHLEKHPREPEIEFKARKARAVFFNHVQPIADILAGFIFTDPVERSIPDAVSYLKTKASKKKSIDSFMMTTAIHSVLHTVGVLVDSPEFNEEDVQTMADRDKAGLNPFCVIYKPWQIRDYAVDDDGDLMWVLLDNSHTKKEDAEDEAEDVVQYRLWTRDRYVDYKIADDKDGKIAKQVGEKEHKLGVVPFRFVNWRDQDEDLITESPFEDISLLDKQIYNTISYLDEMLAAGTFKALFFPVKSKDDLAGVRHEGVGSLAVIPFPHDAQKSPYFDGAKLEDIESFIKAILLYIKEIFRKVGLDTDDEKKYVQSGSAKTIEFQKCEALLRHGAENLENLENFIIDTAMKWEGKEPDKKTSSKYKKKFQSEEIDAQLNRLYRLMVTPYKDLLKIVMSEIINKTLPDLDQKQRETLVDSINKEIDKGSSVGKIDVDGMARAEEDAREEETPEGEKPNA